jgi:glycosyltransferase involved in cell wall biosynthesis
MKKIAYLLDVFPVISETFIMKEILELKKRHRELQIVIFALHRHDYYPFNSLIHPESEDLIQDTQYLDPFNLGMSRFHKAWLHFPSLLRYPICYLKTLFFAYRKGGETFFAFKSLPLYLRKMERQKIDHIHAHFALTACEFSMLISMITGISFSFSAHAHDIYSQEARDIRDYIRESKFMITCTAYNRNHLVKKYGSLGQNKIYLNYHGVETNLFKPNGRKSDDRVSILSIGRLVDQKGFSYLIEAISLLRDSVDIAFSLIIVGDGPQRDELKQLVEYYGLAHMITFRGALTLGEVKKEYDRAHIFVLPSRVTHDGYRDGIPNVLFEAMSMELPVISTKVSGIPEVICDGVDGILLPSDNTKALEAALRKLCEDPELRQRLGKNARKKIFSEFNKVDHIEKLSKLFNLP